MLPYFKYDGLPAAETAAPGPAFYGTGGADTLTGTGAAESFWGGDGDRLVGGAGDDTYYLKSALDRVVEQAGGGIDKVVAWTSVYLPDHAGVENLQVDGDKTYGAGGAGDNIIQGGPGSQQLYGGLGQDVLIGGAGADTFIVVKGEGSDVIQDFTPGVDTLRLSAGFTSFSQLQAQLSQVGSDVKLDFGGGQGLILRNLQIGQLSAGDVELQFDRATLGAQTFHDEFSAPLSLWDAQSNPGGTWRPDFGYQGEQGVGSYTLVNNNEQQIYTSPYFRGANGNFPETPFVSNPDGTLSIWARPSNNNQLFDYNYTSGLITTQPTFSQTYGYFEMRADIPNAAGAWPAFWLIPADGSWPPELDIMETLSSDPRAAWTTEHSGVGGHSSNGRLSFIPDTADGFHTYAVSWTVKTLTWYIDGVEVFHTATPADMHKPMFIIANLALGGWGGAINQAALPAEFKIDYIRAYALADTVVTTPPAPAPSPAPSPVPPPAPGGASVLTSSGYADTLTGGVGADTLNAGQGPDRLTGGAGADTFVFKAMPWNAGHITDFRVGVDRLDISALYSNGYRGADPVADGYLSFVANGQGGTAVLLDTDGRAAGNTINFLVVTLDGVAPQTLTAASLGGAAPAPPPPGPVPPAPIAATGMVLTSTRYGDVLTGGANADTINAGQGPDQLTGGAGADRFVFKAMPWNAGHITDFQVGVDRLDIAALYDVRYAGSDPVADGYVSFVSNGSGGTTVLLDTDGAGAGNVIRFQIATLDGVSATGLTAAQVFGGGPAPITAGPTIPATGLLLTSTRYADTLSGGAGGDTLVAGQGPDRLVGGEGVDHFVFGKLPWNAGHVSDFSPGVDILDLRPLFASVGYKGGDPRADGYLTFQSDGHGGTVVRFDPDGFGSANPWPTTITTLDGVDPSNLRSSDWIFN